MSLDGVTGCDLDTGALARDEAGQLVETGTREAPLRAVVPTNAGDRPVTVFCRGTGYHVGDRSFDGLVTERGALSGVEPIEKAAGRSALTRFEVADEGSYEVHGFASCESIAGLAARQQLIDLSTPRGTRHR